jgi:transmembrane sensor
MSQTPDTDNNHKTNKSHTSSDKVLPFRSGKSVHDEAAEWIARLDADKPNRDTLAEFKQWANADPAHAVEYRRLSEQWDNLNLLTQMTLPSEALVDDPSSVSASNSAFNNTPEPNARLFPVWNWSTIMAGGSFAAVFLVVVAVFLGSQQQVLYTTAVGEQKTITLADNSVVQLNTNTRLKVDYNEQRRGIYLIEGEAHFQVAHNPDLPFEVYTGTGLVRAIGTAFSVYLKAKQVEVVVDEGVIEIGTMPPPTQQRLATASSQADTVENASQLAHREAEPEQQHTRVHAGAKATFEHQSPLDLALDETIELETHLAWRQGSLKFRQETLQNLVDEVSRYTSTKIVIVDNAAREILVGGLFEIGDTQAMLDALELGFGIQVERVDSDLVYLSMPK